MKTPHKEIRTLVNCWVDEGVLPLVTALNCHPNIITVDSCECDKGGDAYVYFTCRDKDCLVELVKKMGEDLPAIEPATFRYRLSLEWCGGTAPLALIKTHPRSVEAIACRITNLRIAPPATDQEHPLSPTGAEVQATPVAVPRTDSISTEPKEPGQSKEDV